MTEDYEAKTGSMAREPIKWGFSLSQSTIRSICL